MNTDERLDRILQIEQEIARLQAEQLRHIATVADDPCEGALAPRVEKDYIREEIRALLGESASGVLNRIETARMVVHRLPVALAALEAGELTMRHVHALSAATAELSDADVAEVEAKCVPFAVGRDYTALHPQGAPQRGGADLDHPDRAPRPAAQGPARVLVPQSRWGDGHHLGAAPR